MRKFLMKLILIASVVIAVSEVKFITNELGIENSVSALSAIVLQFFTRESSIVSFIICIKNNLGAQEFIEKVLLRVGSSISYHIESCDSLRDIKERKFVLLLVDYASTEYLSKQMTSKRFDYSGYYLLYSLNGIDETVMSKVFESFFNLFIYNLNIVTETENVQLTTFYPFTSESCKSTEPVVINEFKNGSWELLEFYPPKTRNFYKCPLKAAAFIYAPAIMMDGSYKSNNYTLRGSDIELLNGFADALNFTVEYIFDPSPGAWGLLKENGEATGAFKKIIDREADLMIGMLSKMYSRSKYISFTSTIVFNPVVVIIPPGAHYNAFEKLFLPFQDAVWIYLLLVFILGCVLVTLLTVNPNNHLKMYIIGREIRMPMLNMIVACVGGSQHVLPVKSAARILLMTFLLFCLIKRTLYTASLFQFLQTENRKPVLSSIEEIMERGFTIYYYPSFDETLKIFKFYKHGKMVSDADIAFYRMKTLDSDFKGTVMSIMDELLHLNKMNYKRFSFRVLSEYLFTSQSCWAFPKNSYLVETFDEKLGKLTESGLINYFTSKFMDPKYLNIKEAKRGPAQLNLSHLLGGFEFGLCGLAIAFGLFCLELLSRTSRFKFFQKILDWLM